MGICAATSRDADTVCPHQAFSSFRASRKSPTNRLDVDKLYKCFNFSPLLAKLRKTLGGTDAVVPNAIWWGEEELNPVESVLHGVDPTEQQAAETIRKAMRDVIHSETGTNAEHFAMIEEGDQRQRNATVPDMVKGIDKREQDAAVPFSSLGPVARALLRVECVLKSLCSFELPTSPPTMLHLFRRSRGNSGEKKMAAALDLDPKCATTHEMPQTTVQLAPRGKPLYDLSKESVARWPRHEEEEGFELRIGKFGGEYVSLPRMCEQRRRRRLTVLTARSLAQITCTLTISVRSSRTAPRGR